MASSCTDAAAALFFQPVPDFNRCDEREPSMIDDGLYVGSALFAQNLEWLTAHGIQHVLNLASAEVNLDVSKLKELEIDCLEVPLIDGGEQSSLVFVEPLQYLEKCGSSRVLVHCEKGVSRSTAVVTAWLMTSKKWSLRKAFAHVRERRSWAYPSFGYWFALYELEGEVLGSHSVSLEALERHADVESFEEVEEEEGEEFQDFDCDGDDDDDDGNFGTRQ